MSVAGLPSMGSNILSNAASPSDRARDLSEMSIVLFTCIELLWFLFVLHFWVEYNKHTTTSVSSRGNHTRTTQCFVQNGPPASRRIIHAISKFLQSRSNIRRMTCLWWQVTHNITIHTKRLSLKESCLKINVKKSSKSCWLPVGNSSEI